MFNALASLAQRRGRRVVILAVVFFGVAGAVGGSVADRLDPYGADDPDTESVIADERLEEAGFRDASVIVLVEDAPVSEGAGRQKVEAVTRQVEANDDVQTVNGYLNTRSPDFLSEDRSATYLAVSLMPTGDKQQQEAADRIREELAGTEGVSVGGYALAQEQVNQQVEEDLRMAEMLAFPLLFLLSLIFFRSLVASLLPLMIGGAGDRRHLLPAADRQRARLDLDLRPQPDHRARPGAGDRLQPLRRLSLPRGDRQGRAGAGGDEADDGDRRPHRPLLLADGDRGARVADGLPPALPLLDGAGRHAGRAVGDGDLADRAARGARLARQPG